MDFLINFYSYVDVYLLIVVRLLGFFIVVPIFGGQNIPPSVRVGLCLSVAIIIMSSEQVIFQSSDLSVFGYGFLVLKELFVGLIMGFVVYFLFTLIYYVGQLIDFQIGFSMVSVFDPVSQLQVPISGNFLYLVVCAVLLISNGHYSLLGAIFYSYKVLPIDSAVFFDGALFHNILGIITSFFVIGYRIALPVVGAILIVDFALGILTKTAPQMNIFSIGMSLKLFVGLIVFFVLMPMYVNVSDFIFNETNRSLFKVIRDMMP